MVSLDQSFSSTSSNSSAESQESNGKELPSDFLAQSLRAFRGWHDSLAEHNHRFKGNLFAIPELGGETGTVRVATTNVVKRETAGIYQHVYLGFRGTTRSLVHGSVVALRDHAQKYERYINVLPRSSDRYVDTHPSIDDLFLVIDLGNHHFSFYNIGNDHLLGLSHGERDPPWSSTFGCCPVRDLSESGISDHEFISEIPNSSIFVVQPERPDGAIVSLYSKCAKGFFPSDSSTGASACDPFQIVVAFEAAAVVAGCSKRKVLPSAWPCTAASIMQQSYDAFVKWKREIESFPNRFSGNMIAAAKEASVLGDVLPPRTEIVCGSGKISEVQLGKVTGMGDLSYGNVVALRMIARDRFLETDGTSAKLHSRSCDAEKLPLADNEVHFLVAELGEDRYSFYNIYHDQFLVAKSPQNIIGLQRKLNLSRSELSDEAFLDQIPRGAIFIVKPGNCQGSVVSLYSETCKGYVTSPERQKLEATATAVGNAELFQVVLLMKIERHGRSRFCSSRYTEMKQESM
jgi:hypothetical protein